MRDAAAVTVAPDFAAAESAGWVVRDAQIVTEPDNDGRSGHHA